MFKVWTGIDGDKEKVFIEIERAFLVSDLEVLNEKSVAQCKDQSDPTSIEVFYKTSQYRICDNTCNEILKDFMDKGFNLEQTYKVLSGIGQHLSPQYNVLANSVQFVSERPLISLFPSEIKTTWGRDSFNLVGCKKDKQVQKINEFIASLDEKFKLESPHDLRILNRINRAVIDWAGSCNNTYLHYNKDLYTNKDRINNEFFKKNMDTGNDKLIQDIEDTARLLQEQKLLLQINRNKNALEFFEKNLQDYPESLKTKIREILLANKGYPSGIF